MPARSDEEERPTQIDDLKILSNALGRNTFGKHNNTASNLIGNEDLSCGDVVLLGDSEDLRILEDWRAGGAERRERLDSDAFILAELDDRVLREVGMQLDCARDGQRSARLGRSETRTTNFG